MEAALGVCGEESKKRSIDSIRCRGWWVGACLACNRADVVVVYGQRCGVVVLLLLYSGQLMSVRNVNDGGRSIGR